MPEMRTYRTALFFPAFLFLILVFSSCVRRSNKNIDVKILFGAEKLTESGKNFYADNDSSIIFKRAKFRTGLTSHSGNYSYISGPGNRFSFMTLIPDVGPDDYVEVSVWRKGANPEIHLVASSVKKNLLYKSANKGDTLIDGWEKLKLEFFLPPNYRDDKLKIYVWNNSNDTVFFDDLSIIVKSKKPHPVYQEPAIYIEMDTSAYLKLFEVRERAFDVGILQTEDDDWVKGFVFGDGKMMKTKLRLKGDWLDHLYGDKWSFRLKLKKGNAWKRLRVFSLQNPMARHGVDEWFLHKVYESQGLLTTRYGFVPVYLNHKNLGLYAWEEHFAKQLVESQDKREGPIIRFYEGVYWDKVRGKIEGIEDIEIPVFEAAVIKPFSSSKVVRDTAMFNQFLIAQNLLFQYKKRTRTASEIFNIDALARYYALCDVFKAYHSLVWHNQRFYYNPVLCKLEPIAYDNYTEQGFYPWVHRTFYGDLTGNSVNATGDQFLMMRELFNDFDFLNKYIKYLELYSSKDFLARMTQKYKHGAMRYDSLIRMEFPDLKLNIPKLYENAVQIRKELPDFKQKVKNREANNKKWKDVSLAEKKFTEGLENYFIKDLVVAYKEKQQGDSTLIRVVSYFPDPVLLLGTGKKEKKIHEFLHPEPELKPYQYNQKDKYEFWAHQTANYLFVMARKDNETETVEILQWPEPDGQVSPLQDLLGKNIFPDPQLIESVQQNKVIVRHGDIQLDHPVIIPAGYEVVFSPGTKIDLVKKAMIISYSPVFMKGTKENPVTITSSDFSGNGFTVLQAGKRSVLNHVVFENMNTLDYKGWTLSGSVTFYESDVDISNTKFYRNQCEDALNSVRSDITVKDCEFDYTFSDAFDSDFSTGLVENTTFKNIGNDAVDFSGSRIMISHCRMEDVSDKGVSGGEHSNLTVENTTIIRANIGIASKDLSVVKVDDSQIRDCNYGLVLLQKKPEYGPATMTLNNTEIINPKTRMLIEKGSTVTFDGKVIKGKMEKLADIFYK